MNSIELNSVQIIMQISICRKKENLEDNTISFLDMSVSNII